MFFHSLVSKSGYSGTTEDASNTRDQTLHLSMSRKAFLRKGGKHCGRSTGNVLDSGSALIATENGTGISSWVKFSRPLTVAGLPLVSIYQ